MANIVHHGATYEKSEPELHRPCTDYTETRCAMTNDSNTKPDGMTRLESILYPIFGRPTGLLGRLGGRMMAGRKTDTIERVVELLSIRPTDHVLEVGFGPGDGIQIASTVASEGFVAGVDYSRPMVEMAHDRNAAAIETGSVELQYGAAADLPYEDDRFDRAFSINSMQLWPDACAGLEEMRRVLKPGGTIALAFTSHAHQSRDELVSVLSKAGFEDVQIDENDDTLYVISRI